MADKVLKFTVTEVEYSYTGSDSIEGYLAKGFTQEALISMIEADLTRRLQSQIRAHLDDGKQPAEVQELIGSYIYSPGAKRGAGKVAQTVNTLALLPPEAFAEMAADPSKVRDILIKYGVGQTAEKKVV